MGYNLNFGAVASHPFDSYRERYTYFAIPGSSTVVHVHQAHSDDFLIYLPKARTLTAVRGVPIIVVCVMNDDKQDVADDTQQSEKAIGQCRTFFSLSDPIGNLYIGDVFNKYKLFYTLLTIEV